MKVNVLLLWLLVIGNCWLSDLDLLFFLFSCNHLDSCSIPLWCCHWFVSFLYLLATVEHMHPSSVFTARSYASAVLAMALCPSVCLSVTSRCSTKTAKRRITQTKPHDSPRTLVFGCQRSPRNSTGVTPYGAPDAGGVGQNRRLSTNNRLCLENVQDRRMVSIKVE